MPAVTVQATLGMAGAILSEAALSFLGLGVQPPTPSWGTMINGGRAHLLDAPHLTVFPGVFLALVVLGFNFLGDGLRDRFDPKIAKKVARRRSSATAGVSPASSAARSIHRSASRGSPRRSEYVAICVAMAPSGVASPIIVA